MFHQHGIGCSHSHATEMSRAFAIGVALNASFALVEAASGLYFGSLALLADAGHNLSDVLGLLLAWGASYLAQRRPSARRTYGLGRTSILAALANGILLLIAVGAIAWEAIGRLLSPAEVTPLAMMVVAGIGAAINTATALLFAPARHHDLNVRGAFLHMAADAAISFGVVLAGAAIAATGHAWIDSTLSLAIAAVIAVSTWDLLWQALELSLDAVPRGIEIDAVREFLASLDGVAEVHDLHIWALSTTENALTAHLVRPSAGLDDDWLDSVARQLQQRFGIAHSTIQVESGAGQRSCRLAPDDVV